MQEKIKNLRVRIDGLSQLVKSLPSPQMIAFNNGNIAGFCGMSLYETNKSLLLSKAWLGKCLGEIGSENPYAKADGKRKTIEDITPTADTAKNTEDFPVDSKSWGKEIAEVNYIEKIDWLREQIKSTADELSIFSMSAESEYLLFFSKYPSGTGLYLSLKNSFEHLTEARFHLGFELQQIKDDYITKQE